MSFLDKMKFWKKPEETEIEDYFKPDDIIYEIEEVEIPDIEPCVDNREKNAPNILIMDDFSAMVHLLKDELFRMQSANVQDDYTVYCATGEYAGFTVEKALNEGTKFDICFLDITLGGVINGIEYDGVDVAILIKKKNPDAVIKFVTGHTLNRKNPEIFQFIQKFEKEFKVPIDEQQKMINCDKADEIYKHIIQKNSDRVFLMAEAIERWNLSKD